MDSTRFDLALPGARLVVCHIMTHIPDGPTNANGCEVASIAYTFDANGATVPLTRR